MTQTTISEIITKNAATPTMDEVVTTSIISSLCLIAFDGEDNSEVMLADVGFAVAVVRVEVFVVSKLYQ